jgi:hypothetical protein
MTVSGREKALVNLGQLLCETFASLATTWILPAESSANFLCVLQRQPTYSNMDINRAPPSCIR